MPQSLDRVFVHIVFSTKNRTPLLFPEVRPQLCAYLASVVRESKCRCYRVGAVEDHVHLAVALSRVVTIASLLETIKTASSRWLKTMSPDLAEFAWQKGYAILSVSSEHLNRLLAYIDFQDEHHKAVSFKTEYIQILEEGGVEYDERYVWD